MSAQEAQPTPATTEATPAPGAAPTARGSVMAPYKSAALFVGDLHPEVQERDLFEIFNAVAPVSSVRVCRHAVTRTSLGYAYVNFHSIDDATKVIDHMNYTEIRGRTCRLMWSQRDPAFRRSGQGNIFIRGLNKEISTKELHDSLSAWGNIISCKVVVDREGVSKGYGFVHFETKEDAQKAIAGMNGNVISGQKVTVGEFVKLDDRKKREQWTNLFVKNIPLSWDEEKFKAVFSEHGEISSLKLAVDQEGKSKGYGFCDFVTHEIAKAAAEALHGSEQETPEDPEKPKLLYVKRFMKDWERQKALKEKRAKELGDRAKMYQGRNLYVKNLDASVTEEKLRELFSEFGTITSIKISRDKNQQSKGFGFVCFSQKEEAAKAVSQLHHVKMFMGKPLYVVLWMPKADREKYLLKSKHQRGMHAAPMAMNYGMPPMYPGRGYPPAMGRAPMYRMRYPQQFMHPPQMMQRSAAQHYGQFPPQNMPPRPHQANMRPADGRVPPQMNQQQPAYGRSGELSAPVLAALSESEQRTMIGNHLYPKIRTIVQDNEEAIKVKEKDVTGKITGMLLDGVQEVSDLVSLSENDQQLQERVMQALGVLLKAQEGQQN